MRCPTYASKFLKKDVDKNPFENLFTSEGAQIDTYNSPKYRVQDRLSQAKQLTSSASIVIKEHIDRLTEEGKTKSREYQLTTRTLETITYTRRIIRDMELGKITDTEYAVLSSSWMYTSVMSFTVQTNSASSSLEETRDFITSLIAMVSNLLSQVAYSILSILEPLLLIRKALMILLDLPVNRKEGGEGVLTYKILKRYNPQKIYGPYKEFNLPIYV